MKVKETELRELADQVHKRVSREQMTPLKRFEISKEVRKVITKIDSGGGITMYGAMMPKESPSENVHALIDTSKAFDRYPISNCA